MLSRDLIDAFWAAMQANDWRGAANYLAPDCVIDRPCSGEQIVGRQDFAALQAWPTAYAPLPGREHLTRPVEPTP